MGAELPGSRRGSRNTRAALVAGSQRRATLSGSLDPAGRSLGRPGGQLQFCHQEPETARNEWGGWGGRPFTGDRSVLISAALGAFLALAT
ncbi:unnamed protein product [Caretta caretta]